MRSAARPAAMTGVWHQGVPGVAGSAIMAPGSPAALAVLGVYLLLQLVVMLYSSHRYLVLGWWWKSRAHGHRAPPPAPAQWPRVTVHLPLYNEPEVARRLIDAVAAFDYPRDLLEIQILDDSTDRTTALVETVAAQHRARGRDVTVHHRRERRGFKAGALAAGLAAAHGEFIAVFDADFVPPVDFLTRL